MKVFVISLERAAERRSYMKQQLEALKMDYQIIDAVDYQKISEEEFKTLCDEKAVLENPYLTKGMRACALSHVKIFRKMVAENIEKALILEDDAALPVNIHELLSYIEKELHDEEVIALSYYNHFENNIYLSRHQKTALKNGYELVYPVDLNNIASTMAYVATRSVAQKMMEVMMPVSVQPDYWGVYFDKGAFASFRCLYPVQVKPALFRSTLDYAAGKTVKSKLAAWVKSNKIPLLNSYLEKRSQKLIDDKYTFHFLDEPPFIKSVKTSL